MAVASIDPFGGIEHAAAFRFPRRFSGILDRPVKPGDGSNADPSGGGGLERPARPLTCVVAIAGWNRIAGPRLMDHTARPPDQAEPLKGKPVMKTTAALLAVAALALATNTADAKGCLKGAVVGGVAGHYAGHHGVLGAIAGCAYGRHHAKEQARQQQQQDQAPAGQDDKM